MLALQVLCNLVSSTRTKEDVLLALGAPQYVEWSVLCLRSVEDCRSSLAHLSLGGCLLLRESVAQKYCKTIGIQLDPC
jgi:hypothetical protein